MKKLFLFVLPVGILLMFTFIALDSHQVIRADSVKGCFVDATAPLVTSHLALSVTQSLTLTTIYTLKNIESGVNSYVMLFYTYPDCTKVGNDHTGQLVGFGEERYEIEKFIELPNVFSGELFVVSSGKLTGTSEIVPQATPTVVPTAIPDNLGLFLPLIENSK